MDMLQLFFFGLDFVFGDTPICCFICSKNI